MEDLSKVEKRKCRELIHTALERECKAYVDKMARLVRLLHKEGWLTDEEVSHVEAFDL